MHSANINDYLKPARRAHLVGIGGVSMCPLAEVLQGAGLMISGSDLRESSAVTHLRGLGIPVYIGHSPKNISDADMIIRTAAVHDDNPEIQAAKAAGLPVFERAEVWGALMRNYKNTLCIAGTHGKTTTSSMATHIIMAAGMDPTVMIGGTLPLLGSGHRVGGGDTIILEACEYCNSFLSFFPTVAIILNIESDHLDFFQDLEDVKHSFQRFADLVPATGVIVANAEDPATMDALRPLNRALLTFGISTGDVCTANLTWENGLATFDLLDHGHPVAHISLTVPGRHNLMNAVAATAGAIALNVPPEAITLGLASFRGVERRFEYKGTYRGAQVYDDYAHHPGELHALLTTAASLGYQRILCAFQPHTYTRTHALFDDFVKELQIPDVTLLAEIYAAREDNTLGISSQDLAKRIPGARYFKTLPALTRYLKAHAQPGDLILTVGAGDIYTVGEALVTS